MKDCDKLKKKAIIGGLLCMYLLFIRNKRGQATLKRISLQSSNKAKARL